MTRVILALLLTVSSLAKEQKQAPDWYGLTTGDEFYSALTVNDSGNVFGQWCYFESGNCMYLVSLTTACEKGSSYSILANTDAGAQMLQLQCFGPYDTDSGKRHRYAFSDFDVIDGLVRKANKIGFAMALQDGYFNVVRFTLLTSNAALDKMREATLARIAKPKGGTQSTRDTRL